MAQDVRELAQRFAVTAKEIKSFINNSREQVANDIALVGQTDQALENIMTQIGDIDLNVAAIVEVSASNQAISSRSMICQRH